MMTLETILSELHLLRSRGTRVGKPDTGREADRSPLWSEVDSGVWRTGNGAEGCPRCLGQAWVTGALRGEGGWQCDPEGRGAGHDTPPAGRGDTVTPQPQPQAEGPQVLGRLWASEPQERKGHVYTCVCLEDPVLGGRQTERVPRPHNPSSLASPFFTGTLGWSK